MTLQMKRISACLFGGMALVGLMAATGSAQAGSYCGARGTDMGALATALTGTWTTVNGAGELSMMGMRMPLPPAPPETSSLTGAGDGTLILSSAGLQGSYMIEAMAAAPADLAGPTGLALESAELAASLAPNGPGCDPASLPLLHTSGQMQQEGGLMTFHLYLLAADENHLYGITTMELAADGAQGKGSRTITFSR